VGQERLYNYLPLSRLRLRLGLELEQRVNDITADIDHHFQERFITFLLVLN
jgi:hypothetical protein